MIFKLEYTFKYTENIWVCVPYQVAENFWHISNWLFKYFFLLLLPKLDWIKLALCKYISVSDSKVRCGLHFVFLLLFLQSYAGKYVPAISYYIHKNNPTAKVKINFKGMAIGDGLCDPELVGIMQKFKSVMSLQMWHATFYFPVATYSRCIDVVCSLWTLCSLPIRCWVVMESSCIRQEW